MNSALGNFVKDAQAQRAGKTGAIVVASIKACSRRTIVRRNARCRSCQPDHVQLEEVPKIEARRRSVSTSSLPPASKIPTGRPENMSCAINYRRPEHLGVRNRTK
jgi:hypothetical protein